MYFHYFVIISPLKRGAFIWTKLLFHSPKDALCQVWLKLAQLFWRKRFFNFVNVFSLFRNYFPLDKGGTLQLNELISPAPKDGFCNVWLKLDQWFWRRRFFNFVNVFCYFVNNYLPLEKGTALCQNKPESKDSLCVVWLKLALWFWKGNIRWSNKRPNGEHRSPEKHFLAINKLKQSYDFTSILV